MGNNICGNSGSPGTPRPHHTDLTEPVVRREIRRMSQAEQDRWAAAVLRMMRNRPGEPQSSEFFRIAGYHGWPGSFCEHAQETFPGWHRAYLCEFEAAMRRADQDNGNDGAIGLPYWDWMVDEINGERFPQVIRRHFGQMPEDLVDVNNELRQLGWNLNSDTAIMNSMARSRVSDMVYRAYGNEQHFMAASKRWTGDSLESPHDMVHVACGFPMVSVEFAAFHPIFWLHHCNVDRTYERYLQLEPDSQTEMRNNQRRLRRRRGERNRYWTPFAPFNHPVSGEDFMPRHAFDAAGLNYSYADLPPERQLMTRFPTLAVFHPILPNPATYMLHVFVMKKSAEATWKAPTETEFQSGRVDEMMGYAGWGAAWGSKDPENCENCRERCPYSVRVDVSTTLARLGLKPSEAALKVVVFSDKYRICPCPDVIPAPQIRGPFFEDTDQGVPDLKLGDESADVTAVQKYLVRYGYLSGVPTGKFDQRTKEAVIVFQKRFEMPNPDGKVSVSLKNFMIKTRNDDLPDGVPDKAHFGRTPKIKVWVDACPGYLEQADVNAEVKRACNIWQAASSVSFEIVSEEFVALADVVITWADHSADNMFFFDGKGGKLAHTSEANITLDEAEYWILQGTHPNPRKDSPVELLPILLHELGHCLGLGHSGPGGMADVMFAYYVPGRTSLSKADKDRIAKLYPPA